MNKPIKTKPFLYACFLPELQRIAIEHGYNLLIHGSMNRDMDLVAVPWIDEPKPHYELIQAFDLYLRGNCHKEDLDHYYMYSMLPGGRAAYVINLYRQWNIPKYYSTQEIDHKLSDDPEYYLDISITPTCSKIAQVHVEQ